MGEKPRVSVILPVYRAEQYIRRCIEGLINQDCEFDFEIIMVNNNSPDQSANIIGEYPGIKLLSETKQGAYAARNMGSRAALGRTSNMAVRAEIMRQFGPFRELLRGADVIFVRTVVNMTSCDTVRYAPQIAVRHLELNSVGDYLSKVFTYGRSHVYYNQKIRARPLSMRERLHVYRQTIRTEQYSCFDAVVLFALLILGLCCWHAGAATAWKKEAHA